jgi:hypothetical protein
MSTGMRKRVLAPALLLWLVCAPTTALSAAGSGVSSQSSLAYVTGTATSPAEQVWVAGTNGGAPELLGEGVQPLLAPNGELVAANRDASSGAALSVYSVAGAPAQSYGDAASVTAQPLSWSADSKYLAVAFQSTSVTNVAKSSSLVVIDAETGAMTTLAHGLVQGASFAPNDSDEIAYGLTSSYSQEGAAENIHVSGPDGAHASLLTHDGRSLNPVWGSAGIAYDHERLRHLEFPVFQIWLTAPGRARARQVTHMKPQRLVSGLVPIAFSANGSRLLAEFEGEDTSAAWTVDLASGRARELTTPGRHTLQGAGISADGTTVLLDEDSFENPPSSGRLVTMPFAGGSPRVLVAHGGQASWNE